MTLQKPKRECKRIRAVSIKPPSAVADPETGEVTTKLVYVDAASFREVHIPCTQEAYAFVEGGEPVAGEAHPGLDMRTGLRFAIITTPDGKQAIGVDIMPAAQFERGMIPEFLKSVTELEVEVDQQTGALHVQKVPPKTAASIVDNLLRDLDGRDTITAGEVLANGHRVISVMGNKLNIRINREA